MFLLTRNSGDPLSYRISSIATKGWLRMGNSSDRLHHAGYPDGTYGRHEDAP